jgi:hypothetical protein
VQKYSQLTGKAQIEKARWVSSYGHVAAPAVGADAEPVAAPLALGRRHARAGNRRWRHRRRRMVARKRLLVGYQRPSPFWDKQRSCHTRARACGGGRRQRPQGVLDVVGRPGDGGRRRARRPAGRYPGRDQRARAAGGGAGAHGPVLVRQDHASRHSQVRALFSTFRQRLLRTTRAACVRFTDAE